MKIDLSTKETYLASVKQWKLAYAALSENIRATKRLRRHHRDLGRQGVDPILNYRLMHEADNRRWYMRVQAREMLEDRIQAKKASWAAKQAARVLVLVVS